jgi:hypothetical protein
MEERFERRSSETRAEVKMSEIIRRERRDWPIVTGDDDLFTPCRLRDPLGKVLFEVLNRDLFHIEKVLFVVRNFKSDNGLVAEARTWTRARPGIQRVSGGPSRAQGQ